MNDMTIRNDLVSSIADTRGKGEAVREGNGSFGDLLRDKVEEINRMKLDADEAVARVSLSDSGSIHEAMIALEKADISFKAMMQVRNRVLEAYQEIMRMQV